MQEIEAVPALPHDVPLDYVLTETEMFDFRSVETLRILFIGDVVGRTGRTAITEHLPGMIRDWKLDLVVVNGENAAGGFGITEAIYQELLDAGADAVTLGNHAWDQHEALVFIERAPRLVRPRIFRKARRAAAPRWSTPRTASARWSSTRMGRVFMEPFNDPFASIDRELDACPLREAADAIVVDFHGEATSEKQGMGYLLRRPRQPRRRHAYPCADRGSSDPCRRHRLHDRCRHDRRL